MKSAKFWFGIALSACVAVAYAHAHLKKSTPADGSTITTSPPNVVLTLSEPARLTGAWIQKDGAAKQKLGSLPDKPSAEISVALPALTPGAYVVSWRAISDDGHVMPGAIHFTLH